MQSAGCSTSELAIKPTARLPTVISTTILLHVITHCRSQIPQVFPTVSNGNVYIWRCSESCGQYTILARRYRFIYSRLLYTIREVTMRFTKRAFESAPNVDFGATEFAQFLASCWVLSGSDRKMIVSGGIVDRALHEMVELTQLPERVSGSLRFAKTAVGLRCTQFQDALSEAQSLMLAAAPNPSYEVVEFTLSASTAESLLRRLGFEKNEALRIGELLRNSVASKAGL